MSRHSSKKLFSWVHLSDIHFQPKDESFNDVRIRKTLPDYLRKINPRCDTMIITGDYRYGPTKEQTTAADVGDYISELSTALELTNDKIVLVPGNHDLDRSCERNYLIRGVKSDYNKSPYRGRIEEMVLDRLTSDFDFYNSIQNRYPKALKLKGENPHGIIELDSCYLLLLNTSIVAGEGEKVDQHELIIGTKYLTELLDVDSRPLTKPIIAVGHHGLDMFKDREKSIASQYLDEKGVRLYLCGHTHENRIVSFENGKQVNVGCMSQEEGDVKVGFSVGSLFDNGDVSIEMYMWDRNAQSWNKDDKNSVIFPKLYKGLVANVPVNPSDNQIDEKVGEDFGFVLDGYRLIGGLGCDGIKYVWKKNSISDDEVFVESIASNKRVRLNPEPEDEKISCYTASVSRGCYLSTFNSQCVFCETGSNKYYPLTADDIALQCIFMAEYDSDCPSYPAVRNNLREFAFTGQGEPGYCYPEVRRAILLTDAAMKMIGQKVSRHVIYTSGITDFIPLLISDYKNNVFSNRVTIHFSLNAIDDDRDRIMPINKQYPYKDFIQQCRSLYEVTKEKIEVGILLMVNYIPKDGQNISLGTNNLISILNVLDKELFSIDLCTVNKTKMGVQRQLSNEQANKYLEIAKGLGYDCRLFASFGDAEESGCGMLSSSRSDLNVPGITTRKHYNNAVELLKRVKQELDGN